MPSHYQKYLILMGIFRNLSFIWNYRWNEGNGFTSIKLSMWTIKAWVLLMINWFTQAMAWDLLENKTLSNQMQSTCKIQEYINPNSKNQVSIIKWWFFLKFLYLILALLCLKNCRNFGMRTLRGLELSLSRSSAVSSQIFCNAPNAPWKRHIKL